MRNCHSNAAIDKDYIEPIVNIRNIIDDAHPVGLNRLEATWVRHDPNNANENYFPIISIERQVF